MNRNFAQEEDDEDDGDDYIDVPFKTDEGSGRNNP